jgi:UDP-2,3-diacylglucosamine pyrophosphatase LpxH
MPKRHVEVVVISDVHLGTSACRAAELNAYLKTIQPGALVLNGDIVDLWDFRKGFWPEAHTKVIRRILKFAVDGVPVHYVTGNHDGALRRYTALSLGPVNLVDRLELVLDGRRHWFLHGDAFDLALGTGRMLSWIGTAGYDAVVTMGTGLNALRRLLGMDRVSIANAFKRNLPAARQHIARYEDCCLRAAAARGYDAVITGHIHVPAMRRAVIDGRGIDYLNSGDWVDSLSALEYADGRWSLVRWHDLLARGLVSAPHLDETVAA